MTDTHSSTAAVGGCVALILVIVGYFVGVVTGVSVWLVGGGVLMDSERSEREQKEFQRRVANTMNKCVYFNGITNETCDAGVGYKQLLGDGVGWAAHMPCFNDDGATVVCQKRQLPTRETAVATEEDHDRRIKQFIEELNNSVCPICKQKVQQRQVGPCVYGTCGHRLYQGKVNPEFAVSGKRIHSTRKLR